MDDNEKFFINLYDLDHNCSYNDIYNFYHEIHIEKIFEKFQFGICDILLRTKEDALDFIHFGTGVIFLKINYYNKF